jgi:hypothetical protein
VTKRRKSAEEKGPPRHSAPRTKEPLYRKVNTQARNVHHRQGGNYRDQRHREKAADAKYGAMHREERRGLDYTPLFRFLLSKVGEVWDEVFSEAAARLDRSDPIFWMVALQGHQRPDYFRAGESSYYSGLYVDADNRLRVVNPELGPEQMTPSCPCCTHTFNGVPFTKKFKGPRDGTPS